MPRYAFVARNRLGQAEKGALEAPNPDEAISILQSKDLVVISVKERPLAEGASVSLRRPKRRHSSVKLADLIVFARSVATMTEAGLPLLRALEITGEQSDSKALSLAISQMAREIRGGSTLRDAVAKHPSVFSPLWVSLIETGEASGQLVKSFEQITAYLEKSGSIRGKVVAALIYPAILLAVAIGAVLVFTLKIIPTFAELFTGFGAELPGLTLWVIGLSQAIQRYFGLLLLAVVVGGFLFFRYIHTDLGRWQWDTLKLRLPVFGALFQAVAVEEFSSSLGTLLKAGVPILHSMEILISTCGNKVVASVLEHMRLSIREGKPLAEPLSQTDLFPGMVTQMIAVGEQTGKLPSMLDEVAQYYAEQVDGQVARMTALLEPVLLVAMAIVIGTLVISMYLPIFQISQVVGQ